MCIANLEFIMACFLFVGRREPEIMTVDWLPVKVIKVTIIL